MRRFGVLGSGEVGQELAKGLRDIGHEVRIGSRDPKKLDAYSAETGIPTDFAEVARGARPSSGRPGSGRRGHVAPGGRRATAPASW